MGSGALVSEKEIWDRLEAIHDAHVPVSLRKMGMIDGVDVSNGRDITVRLAIPCLACPALSLMQDQIRSAVGSIGDVGNVVIDGSGTGSWSKSRIDPSVKPFMRLYGLQI